ncbi:hypothetical protein TNCT_497751 [Trichonephila clavata]|uniref:Uncharacterized protein n=1 Tax=Trichonephila clavata TaxID=2740835 RepID=A0A8X6LCP3_TRICU|nr:hypothetical protein TNCT_497751 [Trichonephila clavata]
MELDRLKKKRAAFKSATTKLLKRIDESKDSIDSSELDDLLNLLQGKIDNIKILDEPIVDLIDVNDIGSRNRKKLELLGALLSVRLASRIAKIFKYECGIHYWTDSTVVYCWVRSRPDRLRIELRKSKNYLPPVIGNCPGKENSADFLTRGLSVKNLKKCVA